MFSVLLIVSFSTLIYLFILNKRKTKRQQGYYTITDEHIPVWLTLYFREFHKPFSVFAFATQRHTGTVGTKQKMAFSKRTAKEERWLAVVGKWLMTEVCKSMNLAKVVQMLFAYPQQYVHCSLWYVLKPIGHQVTWSIAFKKRLWRE